MTPKAVPAAPFGLLARQCHADADVDAAAAIVAPTNNVMRNRLMIALPDIIHEIITPSYRTPLQGNSPVPDNMLGTVLICPTSRRLSKAASDVVQSNLRGRTT
jgi:hypothetical protein